MIYMEKPLKASGAERSTTGSRRTTPRPSSWVKRGEDGRFMDVKQDGTPFKGVRKEG
jgi:hypothetical protein